MRRNLSIVIILSILLSLTGCSKSPRLDKDSFKKYALSDLHLEEKDGAILDDPGFYDMDSRIDNLETSGYPLDHYSQVYSKTTQKVINEMYIVYSDYQKEEDARKFYSDLVEAEKAMLTTKTDKHSVDEGKDHLIVLTQSDTMSWKFECLYIDGDVVLFSMIILAGGISSLDTEWLSSVKTFFQDLRIRQPLSLAPEISDLIK
ncbi:MAG: hypothetical protein IK020_06440 [Clostridiales bacterium]|nr:hypothetical protein [Clostridiales bacterium]